MNINELLASVPGFFKSQDENLREALSGMFAPPPGILGDQEETVKKQMQMQGLLGIASGLFQAGTPSRTRQSLFQGIPLGQQMAQGTLDQAIKAAQLRQQMDLSKQTAEDKARSQQAVANIQSKLTGSEQPTGLENLNQEQLLALSATPNLPKDYRDYLIKLADAKKVRSQDLTPEAAVYATAQYGTPNIANLNQDQAADVLRFMQQPTIEQRIALARLEFETGKRISPPSFAPQVQAPQPTQAAPQPVQTPQSVPQGVSAIGAPSQVSVEPIAPTQARTPSVPVEMAGKPLGKDEVPLIQSQALSPKQKQDLQIKKAETAQVVEFAIDQTRQMANSARRLLANKNLDRAFGPLGLIESQIPGTVGANIRAELDVLRNQSFVQGLQAMRAASPTGGAVGNVSNAEGQRFENLQAALSQIQSGTQARKELERLVKELEESENRLTNAFERTYGKGTQFQVRPVFEGAKSEVRRYNPQTGQVE